MNDIMDMPINNINPAITFGAGLLTGALVMGVSLRQPVKNILRYDKKSKARQTETFDYLITTMGPHVPKEVLQDVLTHIQFDSIVIHNEDPATEI